MPITPQSECPACNSILPQTNEFFYQRPNGSFVRQCRPCRTRLARERRRSGGTIRRLLGSRRRFGIEIEFSGNRAEVVRQLVIQGIDARMVGYTHRVCRYWKMTTDASVCGGGELVSPPMTHAQAVEDLPKVEAAFRAAGATVNTSTGLHIHHEVSDMNTEQFIRLFQIWQGAETQIFSLVSRTRRTSHWCARLDARVMQAVNSLRDLTSLERRATSSYIGENRISRYYALNATAFPKYGTVEIRLHQGTLSAEKILAWAELGQAIIKLALGTTPVAEFNRTADFLAHCVSEGEMTQSTSDFLMRRCNVLADADRDSEEVRV